MNGVCSAQNIFVCKKHQPTQNTSNERKLIQQHRGVLRLQKLLGLVRAEPKAPLWGLPLPNYAPLSGPGLCGHTWFGSVQNLAWEWHHQLDEQELEQAPGVGDGQGSLAFCRPGGRKESDRLSNWTDWQSLGVSWHHYWFGDLTRPNTLTGSAADSYFIYILESKKLMRLTQFLGWFPCVCFFSFLVQWALARKVEKVMWYKIPRTNKNKASRSTLFIRKLVWVLRRDAWLGRSPQ